MHCTLKALVFSDLDGTLLDHSSYSWSAAKPALERLHQRDMGVVLATSKTAVEVIPIRAAIGFEDWPAIVENGGGTLPAGAERLDDASVYHDLRGVLAGLPTGFKGFGDMSANEVSTLSGLSVQDASRAKARQFSEPGLWTGIEAQKATFVGAAQDAGLFVQQGGRFLTLSFGGTKADRMDEMIRRFAPDYTIALGDAPNDIKMLERADFGVIVKNTRSAGIPTLHGEATGRIRRTTRDGPAGWAEAIFDILDDIQGKRKLTTYG